LLAIIGVSIAHTFNYNRDYYIPASDVTKVEAERTKLLAEQA
jgi:cytochrome o ubiquinol oxidase subunit 1